MRNFTKFRKIHRFLAHRAKPSLGVTIFKGSRGHFSGTVCKNQEITENMKILGKVEKVENREITDFMKSQIFMILTSQNHVKTKQNSAFRAVSDFMRNFRNFYKKSMLLSRKVKIFIKINFFRKIMFSLTW